MWESCGECGLVLPTQHLSPSTESLPSFLLEISAPHMHIVLEEPFTAHPALLSQRMDVEVGLDQQRCLPGMCKNRSAWGSFHALWQCVFGSGTKSCKLASLLWDASLRLRCFLAFSELSRSLQIDSLWFKLVQPVSLLASKHVVS